MGEKKYVAIPVKKPVEKEKLVNDVSIYLYSRMENCQIETNINNSTCTILVSPKPRKHKKVVTDIKFIVVEMIIHDDSCAINVQSSKARPIFNFALAAVVAPVALPVTGWLTGTAAIRLWHTSSLKKDLIKYITAYVS